MTATTTTTNVVMTTVTVAEVVVGTIIVTTWIRVRNSPGLHLVTDPGPGVGPGAEAEAGVHTAVLLVVVPLQWKAQSSVELNRLSSKELNAINQIMLPVVEIATDV